MTHCYPKKQANAVPYSSCISNRARNVRILPSLYNISIAPRTPEYLHYTDSGFACHGHALRDMNALWKMCCNYALPFTRANHSDAQIACWLPSVNMIKIRHKIMNSHRKKILPKKKNGSSDLAYKGFKILGTLWLLNYTMMAHFAGYISALDSGASSIMLVIYDLYCQSKLLIKI